MFTWRKAASFNGIGIDPVPLYEGGNFDLILNYRKGYDSVSGWISGYFFIGITSKKPMYGHIFIDEINYVKTAKEAADWVWKFTGLPYAGIKELQTVIDTNGNPPGLRRISA